MKLKPNILNLRRLKKMATIILRNQNGTVRVMGRVGGVRDGQAGERKVKNVSVAFQRSWPDEKADKGFAHKTQWLEIALWEKAADFAKDVEKGDVVECEFHLADVEPSVYEKDGKHLASLKVARGQISLVCKKNETAPVAADIPLQPAEEAI